MAEGPVEQVETMLDQALARIAPASDGDRAAQPAWNPLSATDAA